MDAFHHLSCMLLDRFIKINRTTISDDVNIIWGRRGQLIFTDTTRVLSKAVFAVKPTGQELKTSVASQVASSCFR